MDCNHFLTHAFQPKQKSHFFGERFQNPDKRMTNERDLALPSSLKDSISLNEIAAILFPNDTKKHLIGERVKKQFYSSFLIGKFLYFDKDYWPLRSSREPKTCYLSKSDHRTFLFRTKKSSVNSALTYTGKDEALILQEKRAKIDAVVEIGRAAIHESSFEQIYSNQESAKIRSERKFLNSPSSALKPKSNVTVWENFVQDFSCKLTGITRIKSSLSKLTTPQDKTLSQTNQGLLKDLLNNIPYESLDKETPYDCPVAAEPDFEELQTEEEETDKVEERYNDDYTFINYSPPLSPPFRSPPRDVPGGLSIFANTLLSVIEKVVSPDDFASKMPSLAIKFWTKSEREGEVEKTRLTLSQQLEGKPNKNFWKRRER